MKTSQVILQVFFLYLSIVCTKVAAVCENEADGTYVAHPNSRMFYYCWDGIGYEGECDAGQEFDPFDRVCTSDRINSNLPSCTGRQNGVRKS